MTNDLLRLGVVGVGNISQLNVPGYLGDPRCRVVALCDPNLDRATAAAERWGVPRAYATLEELLADDEVDAVEIWSPTHLHAPHVLAAAAAGKHVSCQKPIATSVADAKKMVEACRRAGVVFRVTENCCHYPPLERARQAVRDGAIGTPTVLRIKTVVGETDSEFQAQLDPAGYTWRFDAHSPGGHLFDDVIHKYAMALWLVDDDVARVQSVVRKGPLFFESPAAAVFEYSRPNLLGLMEVSHAPEMFIPSDWYGADEFFEIQGTAGFIWVTRLSGRLLDLPPVLIRSGRTTTEVTDVDARYEVSFRRAAEAFVDAVLSGRQPDLDPETAVKTLQLAFAVYQSSNEGRPVEPAAIDGSVSPSWWPKSQEELLRDAAGLGLLPEGVTVEDVLAFVQPEAD
jgi:predicted dehydrogenase